MTSRVTRSARSQPSRGLGTPKLTALVCEDCSLLASGIAPWRLRFRDKTVSAADLEPIPLAGTGGSRSPGKGGTTGQNYPNSISAPCTSLEIICSFFCRELSDIFPILAEQRVCQQSPGRRGRTQANQSRSKHLSARAPPTADLIKPYQSDHRSAIMEATAFVIVFLIEFLVRNFCPAVHI